MTQTTLGCCRFMLLGMVPFILTAQTAGGQGGKDPQEDLGTELAALLNTPVQTASKGQSQSQAEAPAIISVITGEEIRSFGYRSVAEALTAIPGMYSVNDRVDPSVGVRGINGGLRGYSDIIKVMIDGQPIAFRPDGNNYLGPEAIPLATVERIEVVRGPASSLFGANAFLGVINIITREASLGGTLTGATVTAGTGTHFSLFGLEAFAGQASTTWGFSLAASGEAQDQSGATLPDYAPILISQPALAGVASAEEASRPLSAILKAYYRPSDDFRLDLLGHFSRLDAYGEFQDFGTLTHDNRIQVDNGFGRLKGEWTPTTAFSLTGSVTASSGQPGSGEHLSIGTASSYPKRELSYSATDTNLEARWMFNKRDSLTFGMDTASENQQLMTDFTVDAATGVSTATIGQQPRKTFTNTGLYFQGIIYPLEALGLTLNARSDHQNIYGTNNTYRAGLVYSFHGDMHLKLLYGTSYEAPTAFQLYAQPLFGGDVLGNPALKPETANTVEAEFGWQPTDAASFTLNAFKNKVKDQVALEPENGNQVPENQGLQDSQGLEGQGVLGAGSSLFTASFAWQKTNLTTTVPFMGQLVQPSPQYPSVTAFLRWRWLFAASQSVGAEARYVSDRRATASNIQENLLVPYKEDAYTLLNLFWYRTWYLGSGKLLATVRVDDLFNKQVFESGFNGVEIPQPGRRATASLGYHF